MLIKEIKNRNDVKVGDFALVHNHNDYGRDENYRDYMRITEVGKYYKENGEAFLGIGVDMGDVVVIFDRHSGFGQLTRFPNNFIIYGNNRWSIRKYVAKENAIWLG